MLTKSRGRTFLKFSLIWTLIVAVFTAAYSTGLYLFYKEGIQSFKTNYLMYANSFFHIYHTRKDAVRLHFAKEFSYEQNYCYFGKIEDDGSLTDVYKTDYDAFDLYSPDVMFPCTSFGDNKIVECFLTNDPDKQGKVVSSSYQTAWDESSQQSYEQHYYTCPEDVFNKIRSEQNSGVLWARMLTFTYDYSSWETEETDDSDNDRPDKIIRLLKRAVLYISHYLTHYIDDAVIIDYTDEKSSYDGAYIYRADVDFEEGRILSGELKINGRKTEFPDNNLTNSNTVMRIFLHKRPESVFEKNKDLLRDNFDKDYLENLDYQSKADIKENYEGEFENNELERFTYDYRYEDGQGVISGICKYEDGYYRYVYIFPLAGFFEAYAPCIAEVALKVWIPGMMVVGLFSLVISRKRFG